MTPNHWYETAIVQKETDDTLNDEATNSALFKLAGIVAAAMLLYHAAAAAWNRLLAVAYSVFGGG